ncbi:MAG: 1-acyl-sn-glycerol-3-phosphate acyltransferase [Bacteroidetes bacterium]|nr:1-acyl-sn-glycerol-3-phosphate acyltransferase [Bacteroidota bacterium]
MQKEIPMLITMNHPNSFMDTIALSAALVRPRTYYMARGDVFKKTWAKKILERIGIVPIYRLRDGNMSDVKKNRHSFKVVYDLLNKNKKIIVLAEGISLQERRLQAIQKGTAKMAFGYIEQGGNENVQIVPIGVTYSYPSQFRSDAYYELGEAIEVKNFYADYQKNQALAITNLTKLIEERMRPLVPTLLHKENDVLIEQLQPILKRPFIDKNKLNFNKLEHQQEYWKYIVDFLNKKTTETPEQLLKIKALTNEYTQNLKSLGLRDHALYEAELKKNRFTFFNFLILVTLFPVYLIGKTLNYTAYRFGKKIADKTCKDIEFHAAVNFGAGSLIWMLSFLIELLIIALLSKNGVLVGVYALVKVGFGYIGLLYAPFKKKMIGAWKLRQLKKHHTARYDSLMQQRNEIVNYFLYLYFGKKHT